MARRHNRQNLIRKEAEKLLGKVVSQPQFIASYLNEILRPKPVWIPKFLWKRFIRAMLK